MQLVFNELSLSDELGDKAEGERIIEQFINVYNESLKEKYGFPRSIISTINLNSIQIAKDYPVAQWRNNADRDIARRFSGLCDRQKIVETQDNEMEFTCIKGNGSGALIASINSDFLISMDSNEYWKNFEIEGGVYNLQDDSTSEIKLYNITDRHQLESNISLIEQEKLKKIKKYSTGLELLESLDSDFPSLIFHDVAKKQLESEVQVQHLSAICNKLFEINRYFADWDRDKFEMDKFMSKITPQSPETLTRFIKEHTFEFEGKYVVVSYHLRYTGNIPGRIYFDPDHSTGKGLICSLTTKLPTVTDPKQRI